MSEYASKTLFLLRLPVRRCSARHCQEKRTRLSVLWPTKPDMFRPFHGVTAGYILALFVALVLALIAGWSSLAERMGGDAYDWMFRVHPPVARPSHSVVAAFDEQTLSATGGIRNIRPTLTK